MVKYVASNIFREVMTTDKHIGHHIKKVHFQLEQCMNHEVQSLDLTPAQSHIIGWLTHKQGAPCARDLEAAFKLSHATVSGLLSRMESKGFIEVIPDPQDRRIKRIYLLEKGMVCSKEIGGRVDQTEARMFEGFSEEDKALFFTYLMRVQENLSHAIQENQVKREE